MKTDDNRRRQKKEYYEARRFGNGSKRGFTLREDELIKEHLITDTELASRLNRSVASIQGRRNGLKKLKADKIKLR